MNKRAWLKGGCAALAVSLVLAFAPLSLPTWAADSRLTTAAQVNAAVANMNTSDRTQVNMIADAMRALSVTEQKRLYGNTIRRLDTAYALNNGCLQRITAKEGTVSTNRINKASVAVAGATVSAGGSVSLTLWQDKPSSSTILLQFSIETDASMTTPVIYSFDRPSNISTSYSYYLRDDFGNRIEASVSASNFSFITTNPTGVFKVYRGGKTNEKDPDDPEYVTPFWQDVIDEVDDARSGDRLRFDIGTRTTVPADVLRALYGRSVWLSLRPSRGSMLTIYGRDLPRIPTSRDYYTLTTLRNLYSVNAPSSSTPTRPIRPTYPDPEPPIQPIVPTPPIASNPPPVYHPPVAVITPTPPSSRSDTSSLQPDEPSSTTEESESELPKVDVEIEAEEDDPPKDAETSSSEAQQAVTQPNDTERGTFVTLVILIILAAGAGTALLTVALCARYKKMH